ncbi:MAG: trigger factor family protein [Dysgonamonadaceae bacterium]|jgi:trigger factor|nr:trigger factor family protein [Dysgonamonadaceae bacterium]
MKVTLNRIDAVNATVAIEVTKEDYGSVVENGIKGFGRKAAVPGFRKGMAPMSLLRKLYGKTVLYEEINNLVSKKLNEFISEEKFNLIGGAIPDKNNIVYLDSPEADYTFLFEIGFAPEVNITIDKGDVIPYYEVLITDDLIDNEIKRYKSSFGDYTHPDVADENNLVYGILTELDENDNPKVDGIIIEDATIMPSYVSDTDEKNKFIGVERESDMIFNPFKAYAGNEIELASLLKIEKKEVKNCTSNFSLHITDITNYTEAEVNQALFDKVFGKGKVNSEEEFRQKVADFLRKNFTPKSDLKFITDARMFLKKKAEPFEFPTDFFKRWMLQNSSKYTPEELDAKFPYFLSEIQDNMIRDKIIEENNIKVEESEIFNTAKATVYSQFAQYGMVVNDDKEVEAYAERLLQNEDNIDKIVESALNTKFKNFLKENITLDRKLVSIEEFQELFNQKVSGRRKKTAKKPPKEEPNTEETKDTKYTDIVSDLKGEQG